MKNIHAKFETHFSNLGRWVFNHSYITLFMVVLFTFGMVSQILTLQVDTSNDAFYPSDDPEKIAYDQFRDQFGKDDHIIILLRPDEVFEVGFLETLRQLRLEIEEKLPYLEQVTGLDNVRYTLGTDDALIVRDFIEQVPETAEMLETLRNQALSNPFYMGYLISPDGQFVALDIEPVAVTADKPGAPLLSTQAGNPADRLHYLSSAEYREMMAVLDPVLERYRRPDLQIHIGGVPVLTDRLTFAVEKTMAELTPVAILMNVFFLAFLFRRFSGVFYPVIIVVLTDISTFGAMAWLDYPVNVITSILPTLLTVVGVADSVHILSGFYQRYEKNGGDKEDAITDAMGKNGLAVLMTSLTTAVGLFSFTLADIPTVAQLGIAAPIGIILALVYTTLLLPVLIALLPMAKARGSAKGSSFADQILQQVAFFSCHHHKAILGISAVLFLLAIFGIFQLRLSHNALLWFPEHSQARQDNQIIDAALGGTIPVEIVIDAGQENELNNPQLMQALDDAMEEVTRLGTDSVKVGKANSLSTIIKESNRALHNNDEKHYSIPDNRQLIAQELLLFELGGGRDLHKLASIDKSLTRFTVMLPYLDAFDLKPVINATEHYFQTKFSNYEITVTGLGPMYLESMYDVLTSMIKSYSFALIGITLLMILLIGKLRIGLLSMVPNLLPIAMVMGIMGWIGLPFDFSNMLAGSVAIGLVVDDTIHFMHNFRRNFGILDNVAEAISRTLQTTGRAIFITSAVLASGFAVAIFADLQSTANFGIITASAVLIALIADFFLIPALMTAVHRR